MRRTTVALTSAAAVAALAFAPVNTADAEGTHLDLTAGVDGTAVTGTLAYGGALTTGSDASGDAQVPMAGLDIGDLRLAQEDGDFVIELDVLDATEGEVAPTALYKVDMTGNLSLMAYRGPDAWDYQVADFSDGYTSSEATGDFDGATITWTVPATRFGNAGTRLFPGFLSSQGISPAGLASLQLSGFPSSPGVFDIDTGASAVVFETGGRIDITVTDAEDETVDTALAFAPGGTWSYDAGDLEPGTYTIEATSTYADLTETVTTEIVVPDDEVETTVTE